MQNWWPNEKDPKKDRTGMVEMDDFKPAQMIQLEGMVFILAHNQKSTMA